MCRTLEIIRGEPDLGFSSPARAGPDFKDRSGRWAGPDSDRIFGRNEARWRRLKVISKKTYIFYLISKNMAN